ncbi:MAG: LLM class F420-dependent oxidoreductase [SAR202 cluster bacterium]|jgi:probable F420-dependent oxidoreductase|nr:LLM class F420-dependent oxidoreductase [SAR202 cluster bacterium]MDP7225122.1 LLM class F420-dependent oxidoreductase [SAR202 cluster bacterium]
MEFGVSATFAVAVGADPGREGEYLQEIGDVLEESGYSSIWLADRTVYPVDLVDRYPDRWGPGQADPQGQNVIEPLTSMSFVAGSTKTLKLGFSILILPLRHPVLNAKMISTLDVLSGGRVIFGAGIGWMPEEFEGMEAEFHTRGRVTDEHIEMFKTLCGEDGAKYRGSHFQISGKTFFPKPVQKPYPPVWIAGNSKAAMRRSVRLGDGWFPISMRVEEFQEARQTLREVCEERGRDPDSVTTAMSLSLRMGRSVSSPDGNRQPLSGAMFQISDDVRRYEEAGLDHLVFSVAVPNREIALDSIKRFAEANIR